MPLLDDSILGENSNGIEVINRAGRRKITHAIHDVDGTHSVIRDWPPVMSLSIHWAMTCGLREDFDSPQRVAELVARVGKEPLPETDRFCIESAGLSALTQMEYGIRRAIELGNVAPAALPALTAAQRSANAGIARRIWNGEERFAEIAEPPALKRFIAGRTPRLFRLYETILNRACRDRNTADARLNPQKWRVPGSLELLAYLHSLGCVNYFVTGAVIYKDGGMYEEVQALGFDVGPGKMVESLEGSQWDRKLPKDEVMRELCRRESINPRNVLVLGDGRTEIKAGVEMGGVTMSRLPVTALRQRELHLKLRTNYILPDFTSPVLKQLIRKE